MHAAGPGALGCMDVEEAADLAQDLDRSCGSSASPTVLIVLPCIGSHSHTTLRPARSTARTSGGSRAATLSAPMRLISVMRPGSFAGLRISRMPQQIVRLLRRTDLHAERIFHPAQELDMRAVHLARAIADPQEMRRAAVPVAGGGIDPGQRLLVGQQQRLMAGVEIGLAQVARGRRWSCRRPS